MQLVFSILLMLIGSVGIAIGYFMNINIHEFRHFFFEKIYGYKLMHIE